MWTKAKLFLAVAMLVLFCCASVPAAEPAKEGPSREDLDSPVFKKGLVPFTEYVSVGLTTARFMGSHTSYEFGNPEAPYQAPLSRLEFPLDSWWVGAKMRAGFPRFSIGVEALTTASKAAEGHMQDSDWEDNARPTTLSIYSESPCRLSTSWIVSTDVDLKISDWIGLPSWFDLRPLVGFRWQEFQFTAHDGLQVYPGYPGMAPDPLPGDAIGFEQTYWQYYAGARAGIELPKPAMLKSLTALLQLDWGYVEAQNTDHHLLRGKRYTLEETTGDALHGSVGLAAGLTERLTLSLDGDFLRINTTGTHRWLDQNFSPVIDEQWSHGVKVWSEQNRLSLTLSYAF